MPLPAGGFERNTAADKELIEEQGETTSSANKWFDISAASAMYFQSPQDEIFLALEVPINCTPGHVGGLGYLLH